jgi:hypothetical protein
VARSQEAPQAMAVMAAQRGVAPQVADSLVGQEGVICSIGTHL